jgi:hypothetical protein
MHSLTPERLEVIRDLDHFAATEARRGAARRPKALLRPRQRKRPPAAR